MTSSSDPASSEGLGRIASFHRAVGHPGACIAVKTPATVAAAAIALSCLSLLVACSQEPELQPLAPASLDRSQAEAMQRMKAAGATAFAGWTWRYEFGAGCRLRVIKRYEGRPIPVVEYVLVDHYVEIVPYAGTGFGVKAYPSAKGGSADLFDARNEAQAVAFGKDVENVLTTCTNLAGSTR